MRETRTIAEATTSVPSESGAAFYRKVAELGRQVANALHFAHEQGVIHRDIKPANLMLDTTGKVYVTDFGLARIESDAGITMTGDLIGTLRYMAPEQALAKRIIVDHRADVYALGATLYEFATLKPIFDGVNREQLLRQVAFEQPTVPSKIARDIPRDLETIIGKSLNKDPEDRYETAADLALDLERWLEDKPILGKRPNSLHMAQRWIRRNPTLVIGSLLGLLLLAGAMLLGMARANANAEHQRKLAYGPTLNTGFNEYADGHFKTVDRMLATTKPGAGQTDLRSFEWYLLKKLRDDMRTDNRLTFNERIREIHRSPGGRWLAVLTVKGQLTVIDLQNDSRQTTLKAEPLESDWALGSSLFVFSPDDRYLYSAAHSKNADNNAPLLRFDLNNNNPVGTDFSGGTRQPDCHAVSVDSRGRIATLGWSAGGEQGDDGKAKRKWTCVTRDPDTGKVLAMAKADGRCLAYSPDGRMIAIAGGWDPTIHVLDGNDLNMRHQISVAGADKGSRIVSFSPDSQLLAGNSKKGVKIWDFSNDDEPELVTELQTGDGWAWDARFLNSDGDIIATSTENGRVDVWQVKGQRIVDQMKLKIPARTVEFLEDTDELVIGGMPELLFKQLRRTPTGRVRDISMHTVGIRNGTAALVTSKQNELLVWQPTKMVPDRVANVREDLPPKQDRPALSVYDLSIAPNGQTIAVAQGGDTISIWQRDGTFFTEIEEGGRAKFTPDGRYLATLVGRGILALLDWQAGERISTSTAADVPGGCMAMEFSRTGAWLATGHGGALSPGAVCVWKVEGDEIRFINKFNRLSGVEDLSFTRDEQWVVAGDATGVELHHVTTGATRPLNTTGSVRGVDVTRDGKRIVTADGSMIRFWDVETGERMGSFDAGGFLTAVRFLDDYRLLYIVRGVGASILDATPE